MKDRNPVVLRKSLFCSIEDCGKPLDSKKNGFCRIHNHWFKKTGNPLDAPVGRRDKLTGTPEERFDQSYEVDTVTGCWNWIRSLSDYGYGVHANSKDGKNFPAHRYSYELFNEVCLTSKEIVRHKCNNPPCVNPEHLVLGSSLDNTEDTQKSGRYLNTIPFVDKVLKSKIAKCESQMDFIKLSCESGFSVNALKKEKFGIRNRPTNASPLMVSLFRNSNLSSDRLFEIFGISKQGIIQIRKKVYHKQVPDDLIFQIDEEDILGQLNYLKKEIQMEIMASIISASLTEGNA